MDGLVEEARDDRFKAPPKSAHSSGSGASKKKKAEEEDPLNARSYYAPEDFYENHLDDFIDFEEAEDYYNEHGGF